jgi:Tol biopolymer transport system component
MPCRPEKMEISRRPIYGIAWARAAVAAAVCCVALLTIQATLEAVEPLPLIGYTEFRTNLPGGRHANVRTMRAMMVRRDGSQRSEVIPRLVDDPDSWTQFAGWSPDGRLAIVARGWQSPDNAAWEETHKTFRFTAEAWSLDSFLVDLVSRVATNVTGVDRVSFHNGGLFFWPRDATKLGFTALIDGNSHPFRMDLDGRNKVDLTSESKEFAYGFSGAPDGRRIAYHKSYQIYLADADGTNTVRIETGNPFNFAPSWSPDGKWLLFVSGEHYNCHPHLVRSDGAGLRKVADRGTYRGVTEFLDVFDFHGGSSDIPIWSADGASIFYTAKVGIDEGSPVELFRIAMDGEPVRLTVSKVGTTHYHPQPSQDGQWLLYGSKRDGVRHLYLQRLADSGETRVTSHAQGTGAMWGHWQPVPGNP